MKNYLDEIKNTLYYVKELIDKCPKCGNDKLQQVRTNMRGTGQPDKQGLHCDKCRVLYLLK